MKEVGRILELLPQLQNLIDRVIECRPVRSPEKSFVVKSAMKSIIRDSFACYDTIRREMVVVLDNLFQLPYSSCVTAFGVYKRAAVQADKLFEFYDWCKEIGLCGFYEYPFIERIPLLQIQALEKFLYGMWQFTDSETSSLSPMGSSLSLSSPRSRSSSVEEEIEEETVDVGTEGVTSRPRRFCIEEEKPLIQLEDENDENSSWETLLEASVNMSPAQYNCGYGYGYGEQRDGKNMTMMLYNPYAVNPFSQPLIMQDYNHGPFNFAYSRGPYDVFPSS
ncbi:hypothetical protein TIFTF001_007625 [Ficus carica]|uniref:AP180 N-terminal homology (ANTH) domain-containing protein n=1 Tax=Ficus carica TaxID=3494 RepID=A0AA88D116_FICCA|nr:hypothetical protein TIFTF001_007625 [Ficus carica]